MHLDDRQAQHRHRHRHTHTHRDTHTHCTSHLSRQPRVRARGIPRYLISIPLSLPPVSHIHPSVTIHTRSIYGSGGRISQPLYPHHSTYSVSHILPHPTVIHRSIKPRHHHKPDTLLNTTAHCKASTATTPRDRGFCTRSPRVGVARHSPSCFRPY